jgi:hypothetical protein
MNVGLKRLLMVVSALVMTPVSAIPTSLEARPTAPPDRVSELEEIFSAGPDRRRVDERGERVIGRSTRSTICLMDQCPKATKELVFCLLKEKRQGQESCGPKRLRVLPVDPDPSLEPVDRVRTSP